MKKKVSSVLVLVLVVALFALFTTRSKAQTAMPISTQDPSSSQGIQGNGPVLAIVSNDIVSAGYTGVRMQPPKGTDYQAPTAYFWVSNGGSNSSTGSASSASGLSVADLLMVSQHYELGAGNDTTLLFDYGLNRQPISIAGVTGFEAKLVHDTRVAVNFVKGNYYIVIIGPNVQKVEALASIIAAKI